MQKLKNEELNRLSLHEFKMADKIPVVIVLDNIRSLNNIGSIFRTADAFKVSRVHLCGITAKPPHREIQKTALGATDSVDWTYFKTTEESIQILKKQGFSILAIEQVKNSLRLNEFFPVKGQKLALVFGHEVHGVSQQIIDISDRCLEIPQFGTKHSFNVSVTAGIVLWDIFNKIKKA